MGIAAMVASIKFNDRRHKRDVFDKPSFYRNKNEGIKVESVSDIVLEEIRSKIRKQRNKERGYLFIIFSMILILIALLGYYTSQLDGSDVDMFFALFKR